MIGPKWVNQNQKQIYFLLLLVIAIFTSARQESLKQNINKINLSLPKMTIMTITQLCHKKYCHCNNPSLEMIIVIEKLENWLKKYLPIF